MLLHFHNFLWIPTVHSEQNCFQKWQFLYLGMYDLDLIETKIMPNDAICNTRKYMSKIGHFLFTQCIYYRKFSISYKEDYILDVGI